MVSTEHVCDDCGDYPKKEMCYCASCFQTAEQDAYDNGFKAGKEEGLKEANK